MINKKGDYDMEYTIILADGQKITNLTKNGTNFVSRIRVDENIFVDNLSTMKISNGESDEIYNHVELIQQVEYSDGWYLAFRELTAQELRNMEIDTKISNAEGVANLATKKSVELEAVVNALLGV